MNRGPLDLQSNALPLSYTPTLEGMVPCLIIINVGDKVIMPFCYAYFVFFSANMGLLSEGKPLSWEETKKNAWKVHKVGVLQFISLYHKLKDRKGDTLKWGDEVQQLNCLKHCMKSYLPGGV